MSVMPPDPEPRRKPYCRPGESESHIVISLVALVALVELVALIAVIVLA